MGGEQDAEEEQKAQVEEKKKENKKKHVYFKMSDPMEDSTDIQFHDVYVKRAPEEERRSFNYIMFGGGGQLAGNFKKHVQEKTQEETEARKELVGTLHFDDGTVLKNNLHSIHEKLDLDMDLTSESAVEHAKKVGWEEPEEEPEEHSKIKTAMYKRNDKTVGYIDKYAPNLMETHPKARIDVEFHKFHKTKTRKEIEKERDEYKRIQAAKEEERRIEQKSRDLTDVFTAQSGNIQPHTAESLPTFTVEESSQPPPTPIVTTFSTTEIIEIGNDKESGDGLSNLDGGDNSFALSELEMDFVEREDVQRSNGEVKDDAVVKLISGKDPEQEEDPSVVEGIPSFSRANTPKASIMTPPNGNNTPTAKEILRERTLRFIRRFCPQDEALFEENPDAYLGIKESITTLPTSDEGPKRVIEVALGGATEEILEQSVKEDYIPADGSMASPRDEIGRTSSVTITSTSTSDNALKATLDEIETTKTVEEVDGDQEDSIQDENDRTEGLVAINEETYQIDLITTDVVEDDSRELDVFEEGDKKKESEEIVVEDENKEELNECNVKIFGRETKRVLTDLKFNPDDPHEPNQEFFFERPKAPTLWQTIFGSGVGG